MLTKPYDMLVNSSKLIDNVRKIQREKAGSYEPRKLEMRKVLEDAIENTSKVRDRDIHIDFKTDTDCSVEANELLRDVFINLVGNSIKHSKGPISIWIEMGRIRSNGKSYCQVAVEDNGPGSRMI